ncbi:MULTISPECIES: phosphonate ABC transporter, permease protein PhnE [Prauserella salsuginis group]|uniref:Phosphonate transport system permease protein n=2 Tax=Prauserella salsuginis group TaxID=2893672 RepID=A0A839XIA1_9PSEU|nr:MULTISPECIES: phosphonate ABC transporter, permease protein PhnE [Prauserella salsuginis group]MBB3663000.1 phosphonate transport system permease protein [Prauserella sediminis]MCR3721270.1 phosphonate transport system permease protein [Prauserella flava]MCR3734650.1 phosphonate transport system permease protein [Prauserella salsuginis]
MTAAAPERRGTSEPPRRPWPSAITLGIAGVVVALHVIAWNATGFSPAALVAGWEGIADFFAEALPPDLAWDDVVRPSIDAAVVTLGIGLLGTTLSVPFALVLALLAARATTRGSVTYQLARGVLSLLRAVPDVVFALVFITAVGLGPFAGVLALVFHNTGVMGKLWAEAMEETDLGPRDALRVAGASRAQQAVHAVLPATLPQLVGLLLYRFDVNVRSSLVLGLVGAGGIGFLINQSIKLFRFDEMVTHLVVVLVLVIAVDQLSALIRRRLGV